MCESLRPFSPVALKNTHTHKHTLSNISHIPPTSNGNEINKLDLKQVLMLLWFSAEALETTSQAFLHQAIYEACPQNQSCLLCIITVK